MQKKNIQTSVWSAQQPNAGQNRAKNEFFAYFQMGRVEEMEAQG